MEATFLADPQNGLVSRMRILTLWPCVVVVLISAGGGGGACSSGILVVLAGSLAGGDACVVGELRGVVDSFRPLEACRLAGPRSSQFVEKARCGAGCVLVGFCY